MACFTAPLAGAIVATAVKSAKSSDAHRNPLIRRLGWLQKMLFGGSFLLAIEHVYHGEVIFTWPFLTAVRDGNTAEMLHEIATSGLAMCAVVTLVWAGIVLVSSSLERAAKPAAQEA